MKNEVVMASTYAFPISFAAHLLEENIVLKRESNCIKYGFDKLMSEVETELFDIWQKVYTAQISGNVEDICEYSQIHLKCYELIYDFIEKVFTMDIFVGEKEFFYVLIEIIEMINDWQLILFNEWIELKKQK